MAGTPGDARTHMSLQARLPTPALPPQHGQHLLTLAGSHTRNVHHGSAAASRASRNAAVPAGGLTVLWQAPAGGCVPGRPATAPAAPATAQGLPQTCGSACAPGAAQHAQHARGSAMRWTQAPAGNELGSNRQTRDLLWSSGYLIPPGQPGWPASNTATTMASGCVASCVMQPGKAALGQQTSAPPPQQQHNAKQHACCAPHLQQLLDPLHIRSQSLWHGHRGRRRRVLSHISTPLGFAHAL